MPADYVANITVGILLYKKVDSCCGKHKGAE